MNCKVCNGRVQWVDCPTGGWWEHVNHPADDHDCALETPLAHRAAVQE